MSFLPISRRHANRKKTYEDKPYKYDITSL